MGTYRLQGYVLLGICLSSVWGVTTTVFGNPQWLGNQLVLHLTNVYPSAPGPKRLVVAGLGDCSYQSAEYWTERLLGSGELERSTMGSCDTWHRKPHHGQSVQWWFGEGSAQPTSTVLDGLHDTLYGFDGLSLLGKENRLFEAPSTDSWTVQRTPETPSGSRLFDYVLSADLRYLGQCSLGTNVSADEPTAPSALIVENDPTGITQYKLPVYSVQVTGDPLGGNNGLPHTLCSSRVYTYRVAQFSSATFGGGSFTVIAEDPQTDAIGLLGTVEMQMRSSGEVAFDPALVSALEESIRQRLQALSGDEDWIVSVKVTSIARLPNGQQSGSRRILQVGVSITSGDFVVSMDVVFTRSGQSNAPSIATSRPLMEMVLVQYTDTVTSADIMTEWQQVYTQLGDWPLNDTVTVAQDGVSVTKFETLTTPLPTNAPTPSPARPDTESEELVQQEWFLPTMIASSVVLVLAVAGVLVYHYKFR